jgi:hypothetical protein
MEPHVTEPTVAVAPEPVSEPPPPVVPATTTTRRVFTGPLLAWAVLIGVVAGVAAGYRVQQGRPEVPPPPLVAAAPNYPVAEPGVKIPELPAAEDTQARRQGDLRELLLPRPDGAKDWENPPTLTGWTSLEDLATGLTSGDGEYFRRLSEDGFRRAAERTWTDGDLDVDILIIQFLPGKAAAFEWHQEDVGRDDMSSKTVEPIPGTGTGRVTAWKTPQADSAYTAMATAVRGDLALTIWFASDKPIEIQRVKDLSARQAALL